MPKSPSMPGATPGPERRRIAVLKVLYLLAVTASVFVLPALQATRPVRWYVVPALLVAQVVTLLICRVGAKEILRPVVRLKWLFLFLLACYTFLPTEDQRSDDLFVEWQIPFAARTIPLNVTGLEQAGLMCLQILTFILASALVRLTGAGTDLVDGLRAFRLPSLFVYSLDQTLALLGGHVPARRDGSGSGDGSGGGGQKRWRDESGGHTTPQGSPGFVAILRRLLRGDVGFFVQSVQGNLARAGDQVSRAYEGRLDARLAHDVAVIAGVSLGMVSFKMLKILPGVPFAPGFKTLLLFPLYVLASQLAWSRWGGTVAGSIMGVIGFLQGDGRYGVLEILKHLAPGLVIDIARPVLRRLPQSAFVFCLLGLVAGLARTTTEFVVVALLGGRAEVYLFPAAKLVPNLIAGTLSGFVSAFVLRAFGQWQQPSEDKQLPEAPPMSVGSTGENECQK